MRGLFTTVHPRAKSDEIRQLASKGVGKAEIASLRLGSGLFIVFSPRPIPDKSIESRHGFYLRGGNEDLYLVAPAISSNIYYCL